MKAPDVEISSLVQQINDICTLDGGAPPCTECFERLAAYGKLAVPALMRLLDSSSADIRLQSIIALAKIGDLRSIGMIEQIMQSDPDPDTQGVAASALARLRSTSSISTLVRELRSPDPGKRVDVVHALSRLRAHDALPQLAHLTRIATLDDPITAAVAHAAMAYIEHGVEGIRTILDSPDNPVELRRAAASVLGSTGVPGSLAVLRAHLKDEDEELRSLVLTSIWGLIRDLEPEISRTCPILIADLISSATLEASDRCRMIATGILGTIMDPVLLPVLERIKATDPDRLTRVRASRAIKAIRKVASAGPRRAHDLGAAGTENGHVVG